MMYKPEKENHDISELLRYSKKLHNQLRDNAKLIESEKPLFVSAVLMALDDASFISSYKKETIPDELARLVTETVSKKLRKAKLPQKKMDAMNHVYDFIKNHSTFTKEKNIDGSHNTLLYDLIMEIEKIVMPFMDNYEHDDVIGRFFAEFLRYTGGDKQGLGIVLTPKHITELFVDLAEVNKESIIFDNCCGTGGFLISSMNKMIKNAGNDSKKIEYIKKNQLIGIEDLSGMFALACANMILRGDGKANLYKGDCFDLSKTIKKKYDCDVGFLNPPYSQKDKDSKELHYVMNCLSSLKKGGTCIAIVPLNRATATSLEQKKILLKNHTLEAVMSMPVDLFNKVGTVTCVMVFKANIPHNKDKPTWFGYWRDDGFVKTKHDGRVDKNNRWNDIKKQWLKDYFARKDVAGSCVLRNVGHEDEWLVEAYMETDYSQINKDDFINSMKDYTVFKFRNSHLFKIESQ